MLFWEKDASIFLKDFGEDCFMFNGKSFKGIFENKSESHDSYNVIQQIGFNPNILVSLADAERFSLIKGSEFTVRAQLYRIKVIKYDIGFAHIELEKRT